MSDGFLGVDISSLLTSILSGFTIILVVFLLFRPWFWISKKISKEGDVYRFKIINFTLIKCYDVDLYLRQVIAKDAYPKGKDLAYIQLPITTSNFVYLSGFLEGMYYSNRPNCIQVRCDTKDLKEIIERDGTFLELIIKARHGVSNLQTAKKRTFRHTIYVQEGPFSSGISSKIIKTS